MLREMRPAAGKVLTVSGPVAPAALGAVLMHEHVYFDVYEQEPWRVRGRRGEPGFAVSMEGDAWPLCRVEKPATAERLRFMLDDAVPLLRDCRKGNGLGAVVDVSMAPWRGWPDVYRQVSQAAGVQIVMATGFYRELELGLHWAATPDDQIWPFVRQSPVEALADYCVREVAEGIHGTGVRAGCIKIGSTGAALTPAELKTFRAAARAQALTGVHVTTHCTQLGAESSQLALLDAEGVDLRRVVIGHTGWHLSDPHYRRVVREWMKRGASFMPTNLDMSKGIEPWRPLVESIHECFDAGFGGQVFLSMDHGYCSAPGHPFDRAHFMPGEPFVSMFALVLPALRALGLTAAEERQIMVENPARILPVV